MPACIRTPLAPAPSRKRFGNTFSRWPARSPLPHPALVGRRHGRPRAASERLPEIIGVLEYAVGAPAPRRVDVFLGAPVEILIRGVLAPQLRPCDEEALVRGEPLDRRLRTL